MRIMSEIPENAAAVPCGSYRGKRFYRIPVEIHCNNSVQLRTVSVHRFNVIAPSAAAAANWAADRMRWRPETEIYATGPRGGRVKRFIGWESSIGYALLHPDALREAQLPLFAHEEGRA